MPRSSASGGDASRSSEGSVQVIARAAAILRRLSTAPQGCSLAELAADVGLPRSTVHRLVKALEAEGLVAPVSASAGFRLGPGLLQIASANREWLVAQVHPELLALSDRLKETGRPGRALRRPRRLHRPGRPTAATADRLGRGRVVPAALDGQRQGAARHAGRGRGPQAPARPAAPADVPHHHQPRRAAGRAGGGPGDGPGVGPGGERHRHLRGRQHRRHRGRASYRGQHPGAGQPVHGPRGRARHLAALPPAGAWSASWRAERARQLSPWRDVARRVRRESAEIARGATSSACVAGRPRVPSARRPNSARAGRRGRPAGGGPPTPPRRPARG